MMKEDLRIAAGILIVAPIIIVLYLIFNSEFLLPPGYSLALDGYVISRTLMMIFGLYLVTQLGYFIMKMKKKD